MSNGAMQYWLEETTNLPYCKIHKAFEKSQKYQLTVNQVNYNTEEPIYIYKIAICVSVCVSVRI